MSYRLSQLMTAVNAALNYPAVTYEDVAVYLDMCVGEINTTLHTGIRTFRECLDYGRREAIAESSPILLSAEPAGDAAAINVATAESELAQGWNFWAARGANHRRFVRWDGSSIIESRDRLFGVYSSNGSPRLYEAHAYSDALCLWVASDGSSDLDVSEYLPDDWVSLFVVPYVCFKYTVRDGGTAATFAEEMEQGFQQLQESYDVPSEVILSRVAHLPAYKRDAKEALAEGRSLASPCPVRAIYESMRHPRAVGAVYGPHNDAGGWGL